MKKKKTIKDQLPDELKRKHPLTAKVTEFQKSEIRRVADQCGLTVSDYLLARAYGYQPRMRVTSDVESFSLQLSAIRKDIKKLFNVVDGKSEDERKRMLNKWSFLLQWMEYLVAGVRLVGEVNDRLAGANRVPKAQETITKTPKICSDELSQ